MKCHYTGVTLSPIDAVKVPSLIPGVRSTQYMHKDAKRHHLASVAAFRESEANCNTCAKLDRVRHDKDNAGFLYGKCENKADTPYASRTDGDVFMFHPDDPMHMECWEPRGINRGIE